MDANRKFRTLFLLPLLALLSLLSGCELFEEFLDEVRTGPEELVVDPDFGPTVPSSVDTSDIALLGERCEGMWCESGTQCVQYPEAAWCSLACDLSELFCADYSLCIELGDGYDYGICLSYGTGEFGDSCDIDADCQKQMVCLSDGSGPGVCTYACDGVTDMCPVKYSCSLVPGVTVGICSLNYQYR